MSNNYLNAFNLIFGNHINKNKTIEHGSANGYVVRNSFEIGITPSKYIGHIECVIDNLNRGVKIGNTTYKHKCKFNFHRVLKSKIKLMLDNPNYNYVLLNDVVIDFYKIAHQFRLYDQFKPMPTIEVSDFFELNIMKPINLANVKPDVIFNTDYNFIQQILANVQFMMENENSDEIHPIIKIKFPYEDRKHFEMNVNIHPSKQKEQKKHIEKEKKKFIAKLEQHLGEKIHEHLNISKDDIAKMTPEEKLNYIPVIEMKKI